MLGQSAVGTLAYFTLMLSPDYPYAISGCFSCTRSSDEQDVSVICLSAERYQFYFNITCVDSISKQVHTHVQNICAVVSVSVCMSSVYEWFDLGFKWKVIKVVGKRKQQ